MSFLVSRAEGSSLPPLVGIAHGRTQHPAYLLQTNSAEGTARIHWQLQGTEETVDLGVIQSELPPRKQSRCPSSRSLANPSSSLCVPEPAAVASDNDAVPHSIQSSSTDAALTHDSSQDCKPIAVKNEPLDPSIQTPVSGCSSTNQEEEPPLKQNKVDIDQENTRKYGDQYLLWCQNPKGIMRLGGSSQDSHPF